MQHLLPETAISSLEPGTENVDSPQAHASPVLEELFKQHGMIPRRYPSNLRCVNSKSHTPVCSDATWRFMENLDNVQFSSDSFRHPHQMHIVCGCCDPRMTVDIAAPGTGLLDRGFVAYVKQLVSDGYSVDVHTHDDCRASKHIADKFQRYHPDDISMLYGKILAGEFGAQHTHTVATQGPTEDICMVYLDPTGRLQDPTLSGFPPGYKLTISRHNLDATISQKIQKLLFCLPTSIPDLKFILEHGCRRDFSSKFPKTHIVIVDDNSALADRAFECAKETVRPPFWFPANVIRKAVPR